MKRSRTLKYAVALLVMNVCCLFAAAQQAFRYKATLDSITQDGFYTIMLTPAIIAACQPQLGDIRIKEESGREISYIIKQQTSEFAATSVINFPLLKTDNASKIVMQNVDGTGTNELVLFIKNTAAIRTIILSGSDDTGHWFVIKEGIVLAKENNGTTGTSFTQTIQFPYSNYHYFQLSMQSKDSLPLNIFRAGIYRTTSIVNNSFDVISQPKITQHDSSDKKSYIRLLFDSAYRIDKLQFSLTGTKFFNRAFTLCNAKDEALTSGIATSKDSSITLKLQVKTKSLLLVINNLDNAPLTLNTLIAFQLPVSVITYLYAGKKYNLFFGDSALQAPAYDLQYFKDSIHANPAILAIKNIEQISVTVPVKTNADNHLNTLALWSIIIAVLLLLIYFSYALLKDINRKTTNTNAPL